MYGIVANSLTEGAHVNIREMIAKLTDLAGNHLPQGLDSDVEVKICNGHGEETVFTTSFNVDMITEGGAGDIPRVYAIIDVHPHADENVRRLQPLTAGVDDELARLVAGEILERQSLRPPDPASVEIEDNDGRALLISSGDGWAYRVPLTDTGAPKLPGMPEVVLDGCICNQDDNREVVERARREGPADSPPVLRFRRGCPLHPRVPMPREDPPR